MADPVETSEQIEGIAAAWVARRESGTWGADEQGTLDAWLNASTAHRVAFLRLHAAWNRLERLSSLGAPIDSKMNEATDFQTRSTDIEIATLFEAAQTESAVSSQEWPAKRGSARARPYAVAVALVVSCTVGILWYLNGIRGTTYESKIGAITNVLLADGTTAVLDSDSRMTVSLRARERHVELERGAIYLSVAKDPARPFVVDVGASRLTDEGTQFSVRRESGELAVVVTDGKVHLETPGSTSAAQAHIEAGSQARTAGTSVEVRSLSALEIQEVLSWRTGRLVFHDTSLPDAVAEFNRYSERKMVIQSRSLVDIRIGGSFRTSDIEGFLSILKAGFPVQVDETSTQITLTHR